MGRRNVDDNPWMERFRNLESLDEVKSALRLHPGPINDLDWKREVIDDQVERHLSSIYYPTTQACRIALKLLGRSRLHCASRYSSRGRFIEDMYRFDEGEESELTAPICLTGHSGVGKSALLNAIAKHFSNEMIVEIDDGHNGFALKTVWHAKLTRKKSLLDIFKIFNPALSTKSISTASQASAKIAFRDGVSLLILDELQFMTLSDATSLITRVLLTMSSLGLPMVYAANFSLCASLMRRPEQEKDRLLAKPIVMLDERDNSADWVLYLAECETALPHIPKGFLTGMSSHIHELTAGRKRIFVKLLAYAHVEAVKARRRSVCSDDIHRAHNSEQFFVFRENVKRAHRDTHYSQYPIKPSSFDLGVTEGFAAAPGAVEDLIISTLSPREKAELSKRSTQFEERAPSRVRTAAKAKTAESLIAAARRSGF